MTQLDHQNITKIVDIFSSDNHYHIIMEYF